MGTTDPCVVFQSHSLLFFCKIPVARAMRLSSGNYHCSDAKTTVKYLYGLLLWNLIFNDNPLCKYNLTLYIPNLMKKETAQKYNSAVGLFLGKLLLDAFVLIIYIKKSLCPVEASSAFTLSLKTAVSHSN